MRFTPTSYMTCDWCGTRRDLTGDYERDNYDFYDVGWRHTDGGIDLCKSCSARKDKALADVKAECSKPAGPSGACFCAGSCFC